MIHAYTAEQRLLLLQRGQKPKVAGIVLQHVAWMRPESDDHTLVAPLPGRVHKPLNHKTVSDVDTVKESGRYNHFTSSKSCL